MDANPTPAGYAEAAAATGRSPHSVKKEYAAILAKRGKPRPQGRPPLNPPMPAAREIPEAAAGFSLIEQARNVLKDRGRYRENARHGAMYVDGHLVDVQGLLRAANRTLQAEGLPLIGNRPERWM